MDIIVDGVDDIGKRLADRIRLERDARNWSLAELATRAGVSKATVSKIEREQVSPTAVILVRIASAFDLTLAGLLLRAESDGEQSRISRAADQPRWQDPATGYARRQVLARPDHPLELVLVELPARQQVTLPASSYAHIRQAIWVQSGELVILESGMRHVLGAGDCLPFGPPADVTFANETDFLCMYVVVLARS
jgi:transcriptional regulator with XRE-family HTH domain